MTPAADMAVLMIRVTDTVVQMIPVTGMDRRTMFHPDRLTRHGHRLAR